MSEEIWNGVVLGNYKFDKCNLYGFSRRKLRDREYPGLIKEESSAVEGVLYLDVDEKDIQRLDKFEGEEYERIKVFIEKDSEKLEAFTYLYKDKFIKNVLHLEWSYDEFLKDGFESFSKKYKGWNNI